MNISRIYKMIIFCKRNLLITNLGHRFSNEMCTWQCVARTQMFSAMKQGCWLVMGHNKFHNFIKLQSGGCFSQRAGTVLGYFTLFFIMVLQIFLVCLFLICILFNCVMFKLPVLILPLENIYITITPCIQSFCIFLL